MSFASPIIQVISIVGVVVGLELVLYVRRSRALRDNQMVDKRRKHQVKKDNQIMQTDKERD